MPGEQSLYVVKRPDGVRSKQWNRTRILQMFEAGRIPVDSVVISESGDETDIQLFVFLPDDGTASVRESLERRSQSKAESPHSLAAMRSSPPDKRHSAEYYFRDVVVPAPENSASPKAGPPGCCGIIVGVWFLVICLLPLLPLLPLIGIGFALFLIITAAISFSRR